MKKSKIILPILSVLLLGTLVGCGNDNYTPSGHKLTDSTGEHVHEYENHVEDSKYLVKENDCGYLEYYKSCSCGQYVKDATNTFRKFIGHKSENIVHHDAVSATCAQPGCREHWECTKCHMFFATSDCPDGAEKDENYFKVTSYGNNHAWDEFGYCSEHKAYLGDIVNVDKLTTIHPHKLDNKNKLLFKVQLPRNTAEFDISVKVYYVGGGWSELDEDWSYILYRTRTNALEYKRVISTGDRKVVNGYPDEDGVYALFEYTYRADINYAERIDVMVNCSDHHVNDYGFCFASGIYTGYEPEHKPYSLEDKLDTLPLRANKKFYLKYTPDSKNVYLDPEDGKSYFFFLLPGTSLKTQVELIGTIEYNVQSTQPTRLSNDYAFKGVMTYYKIEYKFMCTYYFMIMSSKDTNLDIYISGHLDHVYDDHSHFCLYHDGVTDPNAVITQIGAEDNTSYSNNIVEANYQKTYATTREFKKGENWYMYIRGDGYGESDSKVTEPLKLNVLIYDKVGNKISSTPRQTTISSKQGLEIDFSVTEFDKSIIVITIISSATQRYKLSWGFTKK